jgi:hypothetical protein
MLGCGLFRTGRLATADLGIRRQIPVFDWLFIGRCVYSTCHGLADPKSRVEYWAHLEFKGVRASWSNVLQYLYLADIFSRCIKSELYGYVSGEHPVHRILRGVQLLHGRETRIAPARCIAFSVIIDLGILTGVILHTVIEEPVSRNLTPAWSARSRSRAGGRLPSVLGAVRPATATRDRPRASRLRPPPTRPRRPWRADPHPARVARPPRRSGTAPACPPPPLLRGAGAQCPPYARRSPPWPSRWRPPRPHQPRPPTRPNRPIVAPPAMLGHCSTPASTKFSHSCARSAAPRCGSSPSSLTPPRDATSSPASVSRRRHPASRLPAARRCGRPPAPSTIHPPMRDSSPPRPSSSTSASPGSHDRRRSPVRGARRARACARPPDRARPPWCRRPQASTPARGTTLCRRKSTLDPHHRPHHNHPRAIEIAIRLKKAET